MTAATTAAFDVDGGAHTGGDILSFDRAGDDNITDGGAAISGGGIMAVDYADIETSTLSAVVTLAATDNGAPAGSAAGEQTTADQTFCISVYGAQPFAGDLAIADRGARIYNGSVMLVHTNAGSATFPTQSVLDNGLVDAYELTIVTNAPMAGPLPAEVDNDGPLSGQYAVVDAEYAPALGKVILVDPTLPAGVNQTLLTQGIELFFPTGISVASSGSPDAGDIYVTDVGNVFGKTVNKNDNPRKIVKINPVTGVQTLLISEINNFQSHLENPPMTITNLYHPTGIDVDPVNGDLYIADSFSKAIWKLGRTGAGTFDAMLAGFSVDADFLQPAHIAVANGGQFIYLTDGKTVGPLAPYPAATRLLHKIDRMSIEANGSANSTIFTMDGFLQEPRGIEIVPTDPLTGN